MNQSADNPYQAPVTQPNALGRFIVLGNPEHVADAIFNYFQSRRYRLENGTKFQGAYGTGNDVLRILFGAFVKRFKFDVEVTPEANGCSVSIQKGISGAMGGAIGYARMKKEYSKVLSEIQAIFG